MSNQGTHRVRLAWRKGSVQIRLPLFAGELLSTFVILLGRADREVQVRVLKRACRDLLNAEEPVSAPAPVA